MRNRLSAECFSVLMLLLVTGGLSFLATPASALTINSSTSGLHVAMGCATGGNICFPFDTLFTLDGAPSVSGTFDLTGTTLSFSIDLAAATLSGIDGPVTSVDFTNVNYSGSVSVIDQGAGSFSFAPGAVANVSGSLTAVGPGSVEAFNLSNVSLAGSSCLDTGATFTCGLVFGGGGSFAVDVNGNTRYFKETVDLFSIIPEPNTALLLGLGLSTIALRGRRSN